MSSRERERERDRQREREREREREAPVTSIDITLKSPVIMHYNYLDGGKTNTSTRLVLSLSSARVHVQTRSLSHERSSSRVIDE